jgi:hypothetical protein
MGRLIGGSGGWCAADGGKPEGMRGRQGRLRSLGCFAKRTEGVKREEIAFYAFARGRSEPDVGKSDAISGTRGEWKAVPVLTMAMEVFLDTSTSVLGRRCTSPELVVAVDAGGG